MGGTKEPDNLEPRSSVEDIQAGPVSLGSIIEILKHPADLAGTLNWGYRAPTSANLGLTRGYLEGLGLQAVGTKSSEGLYRICTSRAAAYDMFRQSVPLGHLQHWRLTNNRTASDNGCTSGV